MASYLDHNATTPLHEKVLEAMLPYMGPVCGNASSLHRFGRLQRDAIEQAREQVAHLVSAEPAQVIFTSGGTEANNQIIKTMAALDEVSRIAVSTIEHMSILQPASAVDNKDCVVDMIPVDSAGLVTAEALLDTLHIDTALVSVMSANNETGVIQDIDKLAGIARERGVFFHTDACQAAGKTGLSFKNSGAHAMTLSAHKLYGPMGVGALIIDKRLPVTPLLHGGSHEHNLRAGTENVAAIAGFGAAADLAREELLQRNDHVRKLRDACHKGLEQFSDVEIFARNVNRLPNTLQFGVHGIDGETLLMQLDRKGIAVSSGSACTASKTESSHVLKAMNVPERLANSAVRVSFGKDNTMADVDALLKALAEITGLKHNAVMKAATV